MKYAWYYSVIILDMLFKYLSVVKNCKPSYIQIYKQSGLVPDRNS